VAGNRKVHLAAIKMLFDWLVTGQVIAVNPAHSVRGPRHSVKKGKPSVLSAVEMGSLSHVFKGCESVWSRTRLAEFHTPGYSKSTSDPELGSGLR